jgi:hypothetical protein
MDLQLQASILELPGLPPVPADPRGMGRHVSWVVCAQGPHFHYGDRFINIDPEWIDARVRAFHDHKASKPGWLAPIQLNHTDTGERQGDFFDLRRVSLGAVTDDGINPEDPRDTLLAAVAWSDPDADQKIKNKTLTHVSIGIAGGVQRPDTGEMLQGVPVEITKTALPHMGQAAILNGAVMADEMNEEVETPEEEETIEAMEEGAPDSMDKVFDMLERILKIVAPTPAAPAPTEASVEAQIVELREELVAEQNKRKDAEREAKRLTFAQAYPEGGNLTLTAEVLDYLFKCSETVTGFEAVEKSYTAPKPADVKAQVVSVEPIWAKRVGSSVANPPKMADADELTITMTAIDAEATKDGKIDHVLALSLQKQYYAQGYTITKGE